MAPIHGPMMKPIPRRSKPRPSERPVTYGGGTIAIIGDAIRGPSNNAKTMQQLMLRTKDLGCHLVALFLWAAPPMTTRSKTRHQLGPRNKQVQSCRNPPPRTSWPSSGDSVCQGRESSMSCGYSLVSTSFSFWLEGSNTAAVPSGVLHFDDPNVGLDGKLRRGADPRNLREGPDLSKALDKSACSRSSNP